MRTILSCWWVVSSGLVLVAVPAVIGASHTVQMTSALTFSPASLSIAQGDTVIWTNASAFVHTSTSGTAPTADGHWSSPSIAAGGVFSVTFTNLAPEAYAYFCAFHYTLGMTGTLSITNASATPLSLQNPTWANGQFQFVIHGKAGTTYITESSPDFKTWTALSTNLATGDTFSVTDPSATNHTGFYRVRVGP